MAVREISCQEIVELVTDYLEGSLPRAELKAFEAHLAGCPHCTNYLDQMRQTLRITGRLTEEALAPELRSKLLDAFRDFNRTDGEGANGGPPDDR
jgi:anti-sigma factor RsiW